MFKKREAKNFRRKGTDIASESGVADAEVNPAAKRQKTDAGLQFSTKDETKSYDKQKWTGYASNQALAAADDYRDRALVTDEDKLADER